MNYVPKPSSAESKVVRRYALVSSLAGPVVIAVGVLVLVGWLWHVRALVSVVPAFNAMKPNVACSFILAGLALWLLRFPKNRADGIAPKKIQVSRICALLVSGVGLLTLFEHLFHLNLGIDQALIRDTFDDPKRSPLGQMSVASSFGLFSLGLSLFCLGGRSSRTVIMSQVLALIVLVDAVVGCLGYVYGVESLYAVPIYTTMGVNTAVAMMLLCLGILCARPEEGLMGIISSKYSGGTMARQILPLAITLPFLLGWLRLEGQHAGLYGTEFGLALFATSNIITFAILVWLSARSLNSQTFELIKSDHRYRFLADTMPQIIWTAKPDGKVDYFNQRWYDYTGQAVEESKDWGWTPVIHPDDIRNCLDRWNKSLTTGRDHDIEYRLRRADGGYRWFLGRAYPLRNEKGEIVQWAGSCTDIDDQKREQAQLEERVKERTLELTTAQTGLQGVLDAATQVSIIATDVKGTIKVFNRGAERLLGYKAEEIVGKCAPAMFHLESEMTAHGRELSEELGKTVEGFDVFVEKARNGKYEEQEWTYVQKDGTHLTVNLGVTAEYDANGQIIGFLGVAKDITASKKVELELKKSRERLDAILNGSLDGVILYEAVRDEEGTVRDLRFSMVNAAARRLMRKEGENLEGHTLLEKFPNAAQDGLFERFTRIIEKNETLDIEHMSHRSDPPRWYRIAGVKLGDGLVVSYNEITTRKEGEDALRLSEQRFSSAFEHATTGMALVSLEGRWLKVNQALCDSLGYSAEELSSKTFQDITHPEDLETDLANVERLVAGEISYYKMEKRYFHKEGRVVWALLGVSLLRDTQGKPLYFISQIEDISQIKRAMAQQAELTEKAQAAERAKGDFLANMSHEIRTPMNGVIGLTGLLLDTELDNEQRSLAETIRASGESLLSLINDILDFSKIEAGKLNFEEVDFDLRKLMEDILEMMAGQAQAKGLELAGGAPPDLVTKLRGDPRRVRQILTNLISNAIKFTKTGEVSVRVITELKTDTDVFLRFEVRDTGIGITREAKARLFQPFVQADNSTARVFGGTGLGLAICKRLAESMNGDIGVESHPGKGSRFWVTMGFPRQCVQAEERGAREFSDKRVLIVDDNETSREFLQKQISAWGLKNGCAGTGEEALAILRQAAEERAPYSAAIIDMYMPTMDGLALAREIKADPLLRATRVVMLTALGRPIPVEELQAAAIAGCCVKPVRQSALFDCLVQALVETEHHDESRRTKILLESGAMPPLRKERILLAEDNMVNQQVALGNLRKIGFEAEVAGNGIEVLSAMEAKKYDIVLMDCQMPDLDGYETTKEIRRRENNGHRTWIIAMTANVMIGDREKCLEVGMDDYVSKPVRRAELRAALDRVVVQPKTLLDENALRHLEGYGEEEMAELVELFVATAPKSILEMKLALEKLNAGDLATAAHTLKGSCSNWGASPLRDVCAQIEQAGRKGEMEGMACLVAKAEKELQRFIEALTSYRKMTCPE